MRSLLFSGPLMVVFGGVVSRRIRKVCFAGEGSTFPALSVALALKTCSPKERGLSGTHSEEQALHSDPSSEHSNVTVSSFDFIFMLGVRSKVFSGPSINVLGFIVSIKMVSVAGVGSTRPLFIARTENTALPSSWLRAASHGD